MLKSWFGTRAHTLMACLAVLCLTATACAGEDDELLDSSESADSVDADAEDTSDEDPDDDEADDVTADADDDADDGVPDRAPEPLDFGEDTNVALIDCFDGDDFACEIALDYLGGPDGAREIAVACEAGDQFACEVYDRIVEVNGEGEESPVDEPPVDGQPDVRGYVIVRADGIETTFDQLSFGQDPDVVISAISGELGQPTEDTGPLATGDGSGCFGNEYRYVYWDESLTLTILDESAYGSGFAHVSAWQHDGGDGVFVEAFVGDSTTVDIDPGHTTVAQMQDMLGFDVVEVYDEPPIGPTYEINDNLGTIFGELTDIDEGGIVQTAVGGSPCGE